MRFFKEVRYARQALANCLIRVGANPAWVGEIGEDFSTTLYYPVEGITSEVDIRKVEELNLEPVPLGYVNSDPSTLYLTRIPVRRWKQGLTPSSLSKRVGKNLMQSKSLSNCILGLYPSFEEACNMIKPEGSHISSAFHRNWAVEVGAVDPSLCYKGKYVGIVKEGEGRLLPEYEYLTESLAEVL